MKNCGSIDFNIVWFNFFFLSNNGWPLKAYANDHHIEIVGEALTWRKICDMWANPHLFKMIKRKATYPQDARWWIPRQLVQLWGNSIYDQLNESKMATTDWTCVKVKIHDIVRIDHFRWFWVLLEIPTDQIQQHYGWKVPATNSLKWRRVWWMKYLRPWLYDDMKAELRERTTPRNEDSSPASILTMKVSIALTWHQTLWWALEYMIITCPWW